jgi:DNA-binding IscR family transcriptional regulator
LPKAKTFRLILESILLLLYVIQDLGAKKGKGGGYYLIKEPKDINSKSIVFSGPIALLPCASHNFYENARTVQMRPACSA